MIGTRNRFASMHEVSCCGPRWAGFVLACERLLLGITALSSDEELRLVDYLFSQCLCLQVQISNRQSLMIAKTSQNVRNITFFPGKM